VVFFLSAQPSQHAQAVAPRQHDVEDDGVEWRAGGGKQAVLAIRHHVHGKALRLERLADK